MSMKKMKILKIISILSISFLLITEIGEAEEGADIADNSSTYRTLVDGYKGFTRVINQDTGKNIPFENHTIYIKMGDTILWVNDDMSDPFTIISKEKLWQDNKGKIKDTGKRINYTFNKSGIYTFYIKEYSKKFSAQTIIVSDNFSETNDTNIQTPILTPKQTSIPIPITTNHSINYSNNIKANNAGDIVNETKNDTNNYSRISTNPFLEPLNMLRNFKKVLMITFAIITIKFLFKEDGEKP